MIVFINFVVQVALLGFLWLTTYQLLDDVCDVAFKQRIFRTTRITTWIILLIAGFQILLLKALGYA